MAIGLFKYFLTNCEVRPGQEAKYPASIALHHVEIVGLKAAACRKVMRVGRVLIW